MIDISQIIFMNLLSKIDLGKGIFTYEIVTLLILMGLYNNTKDKLGNYIFKLFLYLHSKILKKQTTIEIIGWEYLSNGLYTFEYPHNMTAINYYIYSNNKSKNFRYFNNKRNGIYYSDEVKNTLDNDNTPNYILGDVNNILLEDDIYLSLYTENLNTNNNDSTKNYLNWKIVMTLKSYNNPDVIQKFINKCII
jgi:hypothetical protein